MELNQKPHQRHQWCAKYPTTPIKLTQSLECGSYSQKCSSNVFHGPEARPEGMGQNTPTTAPPSSSRTPFLFQILTGHRKSSGSPQTIPKKAHSTHNTKIDTTSFNLSAQTTAHLTACMGGASPPPHNHTHFTLSLLAQLSTQFHWCSLPI